MGSIFDQGHAFTVTDVKGIAGILTDPARCAYPKEQVKLLTGSKAGRKSVLKRLASLAGVPPNSSVIVYFSGHGYQVSRGRKTTHYLMPHGYDIDNLKDTAISGEECGLLYGIWQSFARLAASCVVSDNTRINSHESELNGMFAFSIKDKPSRSDCCFASE
jgi:hypothetical protein